MKLRNRLLLVTFGIIVFLIVTPVLVLFARGFKFDLKTRSIVKTGTLVVKTEPNDAAVFINDEFQKNLTPATIRFLVPGDYNIRIDKDGYQSWTKRLSIKSQFVTWANLNRDFIALFRTSPQMEQTRAINGFFLPEDVKQMAFVENNRLNFLDLNSKQIKILDSEGLTPMPFDFNASLVWVDAARSHDLLNAKRNLKFDRSLIQKIQKIETNGDHIAIMLGNSIYTYTDSLRLIKNNVAAFNLAGDDLWFIEDAKLKRLNLKSNLEEVVWGNLPDATENRIIRGNGHVFLVLDKTLYTINERLEKIYDSVAYTYWDQGLGALLFANDFEVFLYYPFEKKSDLIFRSTTPIDSPLSNPETGYVFFGNEGKIKAIELDGRDHRNVYTLAEALQGFLVSTDGKKLYIFSPSELRTFDIR